VRWSAALGPALVTALAGVPVRCCREGTGLHHPLAGADPVRGIVGHVAAARATGSEVLASIAVFDERTVLGLLALEGDGRLARIGLSLSADVVFLPTVELGQAVRRVTAIREVRAVDVVSFASADGAILRRSE
jgi:hypothetical protein